MLTVLINHYTLGLYVNFSCYENELGKKDGIVHTFNVNVMFGRCLGFQVFSITVSV